MDDELMDALAHGDPRGLEALSLKTKSLHQSALNLRGEPVSIGAFTVSPVDMEKAGYNWDGKKWAKK